MAVCNTIAHGVLLFLPSYSLLNKLCERWQNTGLWNELCNKKVVISEPRFADEFESSMRHFYEVIESTTNYTKEGVNGALFIAVCRGKVSEGLIFVCFSTHSEFIYCKKNFKKSFKKYKNLVCTKTCGCACG